MDYYSQEIVIPKVDENDNVVGSVERWHAHELGVLHSGFTVAVSYKDSIICQQRKHPLFDNVLDLTASSHPIVESGSLIPSLEMLTLTLEREWNIKQQDLLTKPKSIGKVLYNSNDGNYTEHEMCEFFVTSIDYLPKHNSDYAYGQALVPIHEILQQPRLAPWVKAAFQAGLFKQQASFLKTGS